MNERPDFIEISRRAGRASAEARRARKARADSINKLAGELYALRPSADEIPPEIADYLTVQLFNAEASKVLRLFRQALGGDADAAEQLLTGDGPAQGAHE